MNRNGNLENARDVLSVRDVQQILGIGRNATYELIASGRLPSVRVTASSDRRHAEGARSIPGPPVE